ncbi:serine protease inhibitor 42Dd [Drosophila sechellia]|uniref:GM19657 n=1 Tax=Drosophila sechellia TaxID=7238 RepID=B4HQR1_DROSE|nr:serine protease inhibitor 42Dd [Drosophila sechellia]EDW46721.1 GM20813 [Drosophila sechellia]EDW49147.1 GM19657 [Drosophila sechellia]
MIHWRLLAALLVGLAIALPLPVDGELSARSPASVSSYRFGLRLTTKLGLTQPDANVVVSPLLVQAALSLLYAESSSEYGSQLRQALELTHASHPKLAVQDFEALLSDLKQSAAIGCRLRLLSDLYAQQRFTFNFREEFETLAARMGVGCHRLAWESASNAAQDINYAFLSRSNFSMGELVSAPQLESLAEHNTPFLHVSGVTFRAPWAWAFDPTETQSINFFAGGNRPRLVDAMFGQHRYRYAEVPALDAQLIEVPFATADLRMLIVFPNRSDGLAQLERKLAQSDLHQLRSQLEERKVALTLPKLRVLVHSDLKRVLEELGLAKLFTSEVHLSEVFSSILASSAPPLGAVVQSGLLELQEEGGNADDSFSFGDLFRRALPLVINHPFFYAIGNDKTLLLSGHIVDI